MPWVFSLEFFQSFLTNYLSHNKHRSIHRSPEVFYNFSVIFSKFLRIHFLEIKKKKKFSKQRRISFEKRWMIAKNVKAPPLRKKCPYAELFWSAFTEHLYVFSPNAGKCGKYADQNNSEYGLFSCSALLVWDNFWQLKPL